MIFVLGAVGALAPEIVRLYSIRSNPEKFNWSVFYLVISLLFCGLGGLIAVILPATTYWGAFYVGVSSPVLVNKILQKGAEVNKEEVKGFPSATKTRYTGFKSFINGL